MKYTPRTKPFKHQARATLRAVKHRNYAIYMEPRLGKTKAAIDYCGILALKGEVTKVLILCPAIAKQVWEDELALHFPYHYKLEDFDEETTVDAREYVVAKRRPNFFVAGREETFRRKQKGKKYIRPKQRILEAWRPDVVIIDESHEYKRPGGVGAQDCWRLIRRLRKRRTTGQPYVILLSGTPKPKGWIDLFAQFRIMDERILGSNAGDFKEEYVEYGQGKRKYTIIRYHHEDRLRRLVGAHSIRVSADEAGLAGEQYWQSIPVDLPSAAKRIYMDLATEFMAEWEGGIIDAANAGVKRLRLLQVTGGFTTDGHQIHDAKVQALQSYARLLLEQEEPLLVYCRFSPEIRASVLTLQALGYTVGEISGKRSKVDRVRDLRTFQKDATRTQALVLQVQAGSVAIDLSRAAEVLYFSTPDGWVQYWQGLNRVRGPNQKRPVRYTHLVGRGTMDRKVIEDLKNKEDSHASFMNNPRRYLTGL